MLGKNQALKRLFPGRETKFRNKFTYELTKLAGKEFIPVPVFTIKEIKPSTILPVTIPEQISDPGANLPKLIARVIKEYSKLYNERSMAHNSLKTIPADRNTTSIVRTVQSGILPRQSS